MKKLLFFQIILCFVFINAQEVDVLPMPVGGIMSIAKNVVYPDKAKDNNIEGKVLVKAVVSEEGKVIETSIIQSIGNGCDEAAVDAIKKTAFTPAEKNGKRIKAEVVIPVKFKLCDKDKG